MNRYLVCHWHVCQNAPAGDSMYCATCGPKAAACDYRDAAVRAVKIEQERRAGVRS